MRDRYRSGRRTHRGHSLIELLLAVILTSVVFGSTLYYFRAGQQSIIKVSDHAQARMNAMKILDLIHDDLNRCVVDDDVKWLVFPVEIEGGKEQGRSIEFFALHHRRYTAPATPTPGGSGEMTLIARRIRYHLEALPGEAGAFRVMRNGKPAGGRELKTGGVIGAFDPVSDLVFEALDRQKACDLGVSPFHAITVKVYPRGAWDTRNAALASEASVQSRLIHLAHIESQFACMISIKKANPPGLDTLFKNIDMLSLAWDGSCPGIEGAPNIPMDWVRPPGLVVYDESQPFDDRTANQDEP